MEHEFQALMSNRTWSPVPASSSQNVIGCRWIFKTKRYANGSLEHHKARLMAKDYHQQARIDYSDTFSPVVKLPQSSLSLPLLCPPASPFNSLMSRMRSFMKLSRRRSTCNNRQLLFILSIHIMSVGCTRLSMASNKLPAPGSPVSTLDLLNLALLSLVPMQASSSM